MNLIGAIYDHTGRLILIPLFIILFLLESRFQLRKRVQTRWKRILINIWVSLPSFTLLRLIFIPAMVWLAFKNQSLHFGVNYWYGASPGIKMAVAFLILDYGNYLWHLVNHKSGFFWRFHLVHHTDPDLDITTAFRFHFGELIGSVFSRGLITIISGASPVTVLIYEIVFEAATQFHHSNWKIPAKPERILNWLLVTPRMHGIHHSVIKNETDSNYSVIFSCWDRLHKTFRMESSQPEPVIGVPAYDNPRELSAGYLLKLPFTKIRSWNEKPGKAKENPPPDMDR